MLHELWLVSWIINKPIECIGPNETYFFFIYFNMNVSGTVNMTSVQCFLHGVPRNPRVSNENFVYNTYKMIAKYIIRLNAAPDLRLQLPNVKPNIKKHFCEEKEQDNCWH
jgi:hypothetical protein